MPTTHTKICEIKSGVITELNFTQKIDNKVSKSCNLSETKEQQNKFLRFDYAVHLKKFSI